MNDFTLFGFKFLHLFYYFIVYAFIGWSMESTYATAIKGKFVNRGFLNGPFCPIYGFGVLILIVILTPVSGNLFFLFIGATILTSVLEYVTGFILEVAFNSTWWDYHNQPFNIKGRVCLRFSIYWGILSVFVLKIIHPELNKLVMSIPFKYSAAGFCFLTAYFLADFALTLNSVIGLNSILGQMHRLSLEVKDKLEGTKELTTERLEDIETRVKELRGKYEALLIKRAMKHKRILKAFPDLTSKSFDSILKDVRSRIESNIREKLTSRKL